jgi:hypothetical protein
MITKQTANANPTLLGSRFLLLPNLSAAGLRGDFEKILTTPDKSPLQKFQRQPELF